MTNNMPPINIVYPWNKCLFFCPTIPFLSVFSFAKPSERTRTDSSQKRFQVKNILIDTSNIKNSISSSILFVESVKIRQK